MGGEIKMVERSSRMVVESWPFSPFWSLAAPLPSLFNSVVCTRLRGGYLVLGRPLHPRTSDAKLFSDGGLRLS